MSVELERVGWEDGTLIAPAKVTIGGVTYNITPAEYSGSTPLSAENLKKMEDNTQEALDDISNVIDITSLITKTTKVGTIYAMQAYKKGSRCYFSAQFDLLQEGSGLFTIDSSLRPKYFEAGNGINYQAGSSQPMIVKVSAESTSIDSNVYAASIKSYAIIHIEWEV